MESFKIAKISIKKLFGYKNIEWNLREDINILSGINGTGKSTILKIIGGLLQGEFPKEKYMFLFEYCKVEFFNNKYIELKRIELPVIEKRTFPSIEENNNLQGIYIFSDEKYYIEHQGINYQYYFCLYSNIKRKEEGVEFDVINTFDQSFKLSEDVRKGADNEEVETELDLLINNLENDYLRFLVDKNKLILKEIKKQPNDIYGIVKSYNKGLRLLRLCINKLFKETNKTFELEDRIKFKQNSQELSPYKLSSGEKQMLIILLTVLIQDQKNCILLMDEPEISLHYEWQKRLIEIIRELNPNVQLIIATHSPFIAMDGWLDKITNITDITSVAE